MANIFIVLGLGLAGINPVGMLMLMGSLATGLSKKQAALFGLLVLLGTSLLGVVLFVFIGTSLAKLADVVADIGARIDRLSDLTWVFFNLIVSMGLLYWGRQRQVKKQIKQEKSSENKKGIWLGAAFLIVTALTNPSFLAVLALSGHKGNVLLSVVYSLLWVLLSQSPLFLLLLAVFFNQHEAFLPKITILIDKSKSLLEKGLTIVIFSLAGVFIINLLVYLIIGNWLV